MEHGARNILTVANSMTNKSMGRFITPWLFGAIVVCGCGDVPEPAPGLPAAAKRPGGPSGDDASDTKQAQPSRAINLADKGKKVAGEVSRLPEPLLNPEQLASGWVQLFDGQTLFGWQPNSEANWTVRNGVIHADSGAPGLLVTTVPFADYELMCDFKLAIGGNSGVFLRTPVTPEDPAEDCYELNICDSHPAFQTGSLVARKKGPADLKVEGDWHTFHVVVEGPKIAVKLDGKPVLDFTDETSSPLVAGRIGLQMNGGEIEFRNVFARPLGAKPLFNGNDLQGWREVPGGKSRFTVVDGAIHVEDGAGFLESESTWGNFVLQAEARTNGDELNSGIFFRAESGTAENPSNGYELQIHNGSKNGNRLVPGNAGTGAIFRRSTARFVAAEDRKWCALTLVASGANFSVWVNGLQVTEWRDERSGDPNPRRGRRLRAGHISLQGHDPTTDLDFRGIRAARLP